MANLIAQGGPFIGEDGAPHTRVTVDKSWRLTTKYDVQTPRPSKRPFRWFQRMNNSQVETEVPNIKSVEIDRSLDADAASAVITMHNQRMLANDVEGPNGILGVPGAYGWAYGERDAKARWGQNRNAWGEVLIPNAMLRVYQGYGGRDKTIAAAVVDGNLMLTGLFLIDEVRVGAQGLIEFQCRDMAKLLIEQQLFPPLIPPVLYPLEYYRWVEVTHTVEAVPNYDYTNPVDFGPGSEGPKYITDVALSFDDNGYYLVGTDGGVFAFGTSFYGGRGLGSQVDNPMMTIAADPLERGYWLAATDGGVFAFGEASYHGSMAGTPLSAPVIAMDAHPSGRGYWLLGSDGAVYAFGRAGWHGRPSDTSATYVDIASTRSGNGYWIVRNNGDVFAFGDATYHGGANFPAGETTTAMAAHPRQSGYWVVSDAGTQQGFGAATRKDPNGDWVYAKAHLADPIFSISATQSGNGYVLVGGDGGVFSFGDAPFRGSLPQDFSFTEKKPGNYTDFADIVKDLLLWSGWLAYDPSEGSTDDEVFGVIETTGAYSEDDLPSDMFDKRPVIDGINAIKEAVGYLFYILEDGSAFFGSANWYKYGNVIETGQRTNNLPVIDERWTLTDYTANYSDRNVRSEIIISSEDPTEGDSTTVTTRHKIASNLLRGMVRPAMWVNDAFRKRSEQERMAERIADHILFSFRQGTVDCVFNPAVQINDQVRIYERTTAETYVHHVRGVRTRHDLEKGEMMMTLTTNWLGEDWTTGQTPVTPPGDEGLFPSESLFPSPTLFPRGE